MLLLLTGVLLWAATHLMVSMAPGARSVMVEKIGVMPYKGLFSLVLVGSILLMVFGWKAAPATSLWLPPAGLRHVTLLLVPVAVILFLSAPLPTDIKQILRHPQLIGVKLWAVAHLLSNGEIRSIVLFGGILAWAVMEVIFIKRRDGARIKPPKVGLAKTIMSLVIGIVVAVLLMFLHPLFAGRAVIPG